MIKVLIVDDRDIIRDSLKLILSGDDTIRITGEAVDGEEAINLISQNEYDVVLMDINMPNMNGIKATEKIIKLKPSIKVLASSFHFTSFIIRDMILVGAYGFITKGEKKLNYIKAIKMVANGKIYLSDEINYHLYNKASGYLNHPFQNVTVNS